MAVSTFQKASLIFNPSILTVLEVSKRSWRSSSSTPFLFLAQQRSLPQMSLRLSINARTMLSKLFTLIKFSLANLSTSFLCSAAYFSLRFFAFYSQSRARFNSYVNLLLYSLSLSPSPSSFLCILMRFSYISPLRFFRQVVFFQSYSSNFVFFSFNLAFYALNQRLLSRRSSIDSATLLSSLAFLRYFSSLRWDYQSISSSIFSFYLSKRMTSFCLSQFSFRAICSLSLSLLGFGSLPVRVNYMILLLFSQIISCCFCIQFQQLVCIYI